MARSSIRWRNYLTAKQRVPFLFVTGYAPAQRGSPLHQVPILQKPVVQDELAGALNLMLGVKREALPTVS